jgi:hypothetical protein
MAFDELIKLEVVTEETEGNSMIVRDLMDDASHSLIINEGCVVTPDSGILDPEGNREAVIEVVAKFGRLGDVLIPIICNFIGISKRLAVIGHVKPPEIHLVTEFVDFSSDFVICNRSHSFVHLENKCAVESTIQIEMVNDCNGVFRLDDTDIFDLLPFGHVKVAVSCYSEVHGDYHGLLKLIIRDPWQTEELTIPMHVKARGSFFGFLKQTLGYCQNVDGDWVSFGKEIKVGGPKVIRRLTLINFSSDSIEVEWSISNLVKNRIYASLGLEIDDEGGVMVSINEAENANVQYPFRLLTERSVVESHGKTVVVIEFDPENVGEFRGCVAARSGEFIHMVDLIAVCVEESGEQ